MLTPSFGQTQSNTVKRSKRVVGMSVFLTIPVSRKFNAPVRTARVYCYEFLRFAEILWSRNILQHFLIKFCMRSDKA
ncbi:hypothetical protein AGR1B_pa0141 [Agrobacterium fabacearum S56]|nr:hypothetical protein AGR1B_pa0141 [Agrobacterium fabacearum S56]